MTCSTQQQLEQLIEQRFVTLSNRLQQVARYLLDHPDTVAFGTTATIATGAGVHASALVRFANAFGFSGFSQMQQLFKDRLVQTGPDYQSRIAAVKQDDSVPTDQAGLMYLQQISAANERAMQQLTEELDPQLLTQACELLAQARIIHLQGARRAYPVASYASYLLSNTGLAVQLLDGVGYMQQAALNLVTSEDVILAISFAPYAPETQLAINRANAAGAKVIVITDSRLSPLAAEADVTLLVREAEVHSFRSLNASMNLIQALVLALIHDTEAVTAI
ncbi:MurR/RpiR family transcriptional regulator [Rheinheimera sp. MM224]|uniref:MurR/RpiR family transcriptional regulator n=1 Tax=Rheinheimera sp. MM224 TaxID=3019969 RepID=UPI0021F8A305|nr:MurR/RpiR family transcriptional regulator [Rheinheimera sp. MM224]CAI3798443.1 HTH-type transcriptional regulator HexR [Rheinheimera sp. MM224]